MKGKSEDTNQVRGARGVRMVATRAIGVETRDWATRQTGNLHPTSFLHALPRITLSLVVSKSSEADLIEGE